MFVVSQEDSLTPLLNAARNDDVEIVRLLLAHGADTEAKTKVSRIAVPLSSKPQGHLGQPRFALNAVRQRQGSGGQNN